MLFDFSVGVGNNISIPATNYRARGPPSPLDNRFLQLICQSAIIITIAMDVNAMARYLMKKIASRLGVELAACLSASGSPAQVGLKTPSGAAPLQYAAIPM